MAFVATACRKDRTRLGVVCNAWLGVVCNAACRLYHTIPAPCNTMQYNKLLLSRVLNQPFNLWQIKRRGVHNMKNVPIKKGRD